MKNPILWNEAFARVSSAGFPARSTPGFGSYGKLGQSGDILGHLGVIGKHLDVVSGKEEPGR